jgi:hypothetical protein
MIEMLNNEAAVMVLVVGAVIAVGAIIAMIVIAVVYGVKMRVSPQRGLEITPQAAGQPVQCKDCPRIDGALRVLADLALDTGVKLERLLCMMTLADEQREIIHNALDTFGDELNRAYRMLLVGKYEWADDDAKVYSLIIIKYVDDVSRHIEQWWRKDNDKPQKERQRLVKADLEDVVTKYVNIYRGACEVYYPHHKAYVKMDAARAILAPETGRSPLYFQYLDTLTEIWNECEKLRDVTDARISEHELTLKSSIVKAYAFDGSKA